MGTRFLLIVGIVVEQRFNERIAGMFYSATRMMNVDGFNYERNRSHPVKSSRLIGLLTYSGPQEFFTARTLARKITRGCKENGGAQNDWRKKIGYIANLRYLCRKVVSDLLDLLGFAKAGKVQRSRL